MRVYYTRPLLRIVEGLDDTLAVKCRMGIEITPTLEAWIGEFPRNVAVEFSYNTIPDETIDYASEPLIYMPDEFSFHLDIGNLGRLARELLVSVLPLDASVWQSKHDVRIAELWLGGQSDVLTRDERAQLEQAMRQVRSMPTQRKIFVIDMASLSDHAARLGTPDAIREVGGVVHEEVSSACDYYITNRPEAAEAARKAGVKQVIDTLTLSVMVSGPT